MLLVCQVSVRSNQLLPTSLLYPLSACQLSLAELMIVATSKIWNKLLDSIVLALSIDSFWQQLCSLNFSAFGTSVNLEVIFRYNLGHYKKSLID